MSKPKPFSLKEAARKDDLECDFVYDPKYPNFKVKLRFTPRSKLQQLGKAATVIVFDDIAKGRRQQVDDVKLASLFSAAAVIGWEGLTVGIAKTMIPLEPDADDTQVVDFSLENLDMLIKGCSVFDAFVQSTAMDLGAFNPRQPAELGNSESSPSGS